MNNLNWGSGHQEIIRKQYFLLLLLFLTLQRLLAFQKGWAVWMSLLTSELVTVSVSLTIADRFTNCISKIFENEVAFDLFSCLLSLFLLLFYTL